MSQDNNKLADALKRIVGDRPNRQDDPDLENYATRPADKQTRGLPTPAPDPAYSIASPLTEQSRTEVDVVIDVPTGATSVTVKIASQIVMKDANGSEIVYNYSVP